MALGGAMGATWWEVIGYHTIYPYLCLFRRYYIRPVLVFIQSLMHRSSLWLHVVLRKLQVRVLIFGFVNAQKQQEKQSAQWREPQVAKS